MNGIIIVICAMLLLAYLGEISSERTRIPTVILLLFLGWISREIAGLLRFEIPDLNPVLPFLGTIGLILIVLEGSNELKIDRSKVGVIRNSFLMALLVMIFLVVCFGAVFSWYAGVPFHTGIVNALPLSVISSSIAIPSSRNIGHQEREFVIYESSLSDILGVLFFNFIIVHNTLTLNTAGLFLLQIVLVSLISLFSVMVLSYLLGRLRHYITYTPIILLVILIYAVAKSLDLSGLVFILIFGLFLGNIEVLKTFQPVKGIMERIDTKKLGVEIIKFKAITIEATFLVRSLFFLLFGFVMESSVFLNLNTLPWALGIVTIIYFSRFLFLKIMKLPEIPLIFFSPRGLITVLLFISITPSLNISFINNSLIIQVIILSVLATTAGLLRYKQ
jgi:hypothetical protein